MGRLAKCKMQNAKGNTFVFFAKTLSSKQQIANSYEQAPLNIKYQLSNIGLYSLGIKCVQLVQGLWIKMCTTLSSTQALLVKISAVCTNSVQSPIHQQFIHSRFGEASIYRNTGLCTVSTEPTITTKSEYIKRQEEPIKENS